MRTAEGSCGTVLHRLIQEQLRYGNLTDTRTLLAIQQQALRGGSSSSGGGGHGSPRSSLESLTQEETQYIQMSTREDPQGQEHQDLLHSESQGCHLYQLHGEELPTYEQAKAHSQYLTSQKGPTQYLTSQKGPTEQDLNIMGGPSEAQWDLKREHARSLSERLMQLSLERSAPQHSLGSAHSYPQLYTDNITNMVAADRPGAQLYADQRGPPPDYPLFNRIPGYMLSHSQEHGQFYREPPPPFYSQHHSFVSAQSQVAPSPPAAPGHNLSQTQMLMRENERLRKELEVYSEKASRLQKLEFEIQRISEAYETLMKGSAKREALEKTLRNKLEAEIKRMHDFNRDLRDQLDSAIKQRSAKEAECSDQRHHVFVKLLEQNEEQQREREQLERQVQHLRVSAEECQQRGEQLEQALLSTQVRNRQLVEELQRKRAYVEKVERLQGALSQLQAACEKRETLELRLRTRLEQELKSLRAQQSHRQAADPMSSEPSSSMLQQQLREREERVLALEADLTRWEQKYLEESTMKQFAMDAAATAAAQRDTTIIKHSPRQSPNSSFNEDLPLSSHRHQEMENRIRALHAQLLEKDAVIKVIQQHSRWEQGQLERQGPRLTRWEQGQLERQGLRLTSSVPSRWEQGQLERQGPRLTRSVPSINNLTSSTESKGKSLSDDQTGAAALRLQPRAPSRDCSTQSDEAALEPEPTEVISAASSVETTEKLLQTCERISSSDAEVVEILI